MRTIILVSLSIFFSMAKSQSVLNQPINDSAQYTGKVTKHAFVNKKGNVSDSIFEYYFKTDSNEYFIKLCEGAFKKKELAAYENKWVTVKAKIKTGLWDDGCVKNTEIPPQSRGGEYIVLFSISYSSHLILQYADGNGNVYSIEDNWFEYTPVKPINSSSGIYSGGNAVKKKITDAQIQEINDAFAAIFENKKIHIEKRVMGSGMLKCENANTITTVIIGNCEEKNALEKMLAELKTN